MKKNLIKYLLSTSLISSPILCYTVSCSNGTPSNDNANYNLNKIMGVLSNEFSWDFYIDGELTSEKASAKINEISSKPENKDFFVKKFVSYEESDRNYKNYYLKIDYIKNEGFKFFIFDYNNNDLSNITYSYDQYFKYSIPKTQSDQIYNKLIGFHKQITDINYFKKLSNNSLREVANNLYDDFFKTIFKSKNEIDNNIEDDKLTTYKTFKLMYFSDTKNNFDNELGGFNQEFLIDNSLTDRPFTIQIVDNNSKLGLDLNSYNDSWLDYNKDNSSYRDYYDSKTGDFINRKLSSLINLDNATLNFNWSVLSPFEINKKPYIYNLLNIDFKKLSTQDNTANFDNTDALIKSEKIDVKNIADYKGIFEDTSSNDKLNLSELNLSVFSSFENNNAFDFFKTLFYGKNKDYPLFIKPFNRFNNLFNCIVPKESKNSINFFDRGQITLSIDNVKINFNCSNNSFKFDSQDDWTNFYNTLINNSSGKTLNIEINQPQDKFPFFNNAFNFNIGLI